MCIYVRFGCLLIPIFFFLDNGSISRVQNSILNVTNHSVNDDYGKIYEMLQIVYPQLKTVAIKKMKT